jgi:hypothetical protein
MALIRGEPSRRNVASVLIVPISKRLRTRAANSGASFAISPHAAARRSFLSPVTTGNPHEVTGLPPTGRRAHR